MEDMGYRRLAMVVALVLTACMEEASPVAAQHAKAALSAPVKAACKEVKCVSSCDGVDASFDDPVYSFSGSFSAPGAQETIVSLFPCGESLTRRQAGLTAL